jgi:hypothetical protein
LNLRPSGYEPDELPGCSTPRPAGKGVVWGDVLGLSRLRALAGSRPSPVLGGRGASPARRRPALPRLGAQYHGRCGVSRPSSGWGRVGHPRHGHRAGEASLGGRAPSCVLLLLLLTGVSAWMPRRGGAPGVALPLGRGRSLGRLGPVGCARRRACTPGLSTWWSTTALMARPGLRVGFPLRCLQRLSRPCLATRLRGWRHDRSTRGTSTPVLSY